MTQKIADPQRIGILGASHGGYATLMGQAREPQLFKAGVAWVAVSDLQMTYSLRWSEATGCRGADAEPKVSVDRGGA